MKRKEYITCQANSFPCSRCGTVIPEEAGSYQSEKDDPFICDDCIEVEA